MKNPPVFLKTPEDESPMTEKEFKRKFSDEDNPYNAMKLIQKEMNVYFPKAEPASIVYGHSANGAAVGWIMTKMRHEIKGGPMDGLKIYPAFGIHGNDGRNRTRYFMGMVLDDGKKTAANVAHWDYGLKRTERRDLDAEAKMFAVSYQMWWKGMEQGGLPLFGEYLARKVEGLYAGLEQTPAKTDLPKERCVYRHKDYMEWFKEKLNRKQTVFSALSVVTHSAHMMSVRRQLDTLYTSDRLIHAQALGLVAPTRMSNENLHVIAEAQDAMKKVAKAKRKDTDERASKGRNVRRGKGSPVRSR